MPIIEFKCRCGHVEEVLYLTFAEADKASTITCPNCARLGGWTTPPMMKRIVSLPGKPLFLGDGWTSPGALGGKHTTVGGDPFKAAKEFAEENGAANIANAVKGAQ